MAWGAQDGSWNCEVIDELSPRPGELSLLKLGSGGFTTSNLDGHLRNIGIETVFYVGSFMAQVVTTEEVIGLL